MRIEMGALVMRGLAAPSVPLCTLPQHVPHRYGVPAAWLAHKTCSSLFAVCIFFPSNLRWPSAVSMPALVLSAF